MIPPWKSARASWLNRALALAAGLALLASLAVWWQSQRELDVVERLTAWVGENKDGPSFVTRERQGLGRPDGFKLGGERMFVLQAQTL